MKRIKDKINEVTLRLCVRAKTAAKQAAVKLREKDGSFFTEHGLAIVIVVVIAGIVLVAVIALFKDKIFPNLSNKTDEFFSLN